MDKKQGSFLDKFDKVIDDQPQDITYQTSLFGEVCRYCGNTGWIYKKLLNVYFRCESCNVEPFDNPNDLSNIKY